MIPNIVPLTFEWYKGARETLLHQSSNWDQDALQDYEFCCEGCDG